MKRRERREALNDAFIMLIPSALRAGSPRNDATAATGAKFVKATLLLWFLVSVLSNPLQVVLLSSLAVVELSREFSGKKRRCPLNARRRHRHRQCCRRSRRLAFFSEKKRTRRRNRERNCKETRKERTERTRAGQGQEFTNAQRLNLLGNAPSRAKGPVRP